MTSDPCLAFYGDDFTGSADLILQYQRFGLDGVLFLGSPGRAELEAAAEKHPVVGVAGVTRALPPEDIRRRLIPSLERLIGLNPDFLLYKVCSTADSSPFVGSFEPAITWGRQLLDGLPVPVLVAQPNLGRYTAFSNHFAVDRGNVFRLDRQPIMANHPVTPMKEADLRRHLEQQLNAPVSSIDVLDLARSDQGLQRYHQAAHDGAAAVVLDSLTDEDLARAGKLVLQSGEGRARFGVGSSGFGMGIAAALGRRSKPGPDHIAKSHRPVLAVSGSCSSLTSEQIAFAETAGWRTIALEPEANDSDWDREVYMAAEEARREIRAGRSVVIYTCGENRPRTPAPVRVTKIAHGLAEAIRHCRLSADVDRVIIAGGDTSGYVVTALNAKSMISAGTVAEQTLAFRLQSDDPAVDGLDAVLKGGQIGGEDFFEVVRTGEPPSEA